MKYKDYPKLIDRSNIIFRINGQESLKAIRECFLTPSIHELIERTARKLSKANLQGEQLVSLDLVVHAQEIED